MLLLGDLWCYWDVLARDKFLPKNACRCVFRGVVRQRLGLRWNVWNALVFGTERKQQDAYVCVCGCTMHLASTTITNHPPTNHQRSLRNQGTRTFLRAGQKVPQFFDAGFQIALNQHFGVITNEFHAGPDGKLHHRRETKALNEGVLKMGQAMRMSARLVAPCQRTASSATL